MTVAASIYGPAQADLRLVEDTLDRIKHVEKYPMLSKMLEHVLAGGGKRIRPAIALLAGKFGAYDAEVHVPLAASIELLHAATLVHDDVIDASPTRRGRDTANALFNNSAAVMLGDYMFAHSAELISRTDNTQVVRLFARTLMQIAGGELHQDMSAYDYGQDTMSYFGRIEGKTASLFATSAEGGAIVARCGRDERQALRQYGLNVGMAFQVVDDILDFAGDEAEMGKPIGSDLMQGTLTLPSLLLMERHPKDNPIRKAFRTKKPRAEHVAEAVYMVRNSSILEESYDVARDFRDRALRALEALPPGDARTALEDIADYVLERRA
ncbi:MAG TPA: polyprenyl synthetase family protein [Dehalococcoidia bacterium]|nr:polyprenyl synthetase family protein [Dehalococcoidia bacterium]